MSVTSRGSKAGFPGCNVPVRSAGKSGVTNWEGMMAELFHLGEYTRAECSKALLFVSQPDTRGKKYLGLHFFGEKES